MVVGSFVRIESMVEPASAQLRPYWGHSNRMCTTTESCHCWQVGGGVLPGYEVGTRECDGSARF